MRALVWHYRDLRLEDNPALFHACEEQDEVYAFYLHAPEEEGKWKRGGASKWWLHHSLEDLRSRYEQRGGRLLIREGPALEQLHSLLKETGAKALYWNRRHEPHLQQRDESIRRRLEQQGISCHLFEGTSLLSPPEEFLNRAGKPYCVFTPFWKALEQTLQVPLPLSAPSISSKKNLNSLSVNDLGLSPAHEWADEIAKVWQPGRQGALKALERFRQEGAPHYGEDRDFPDREGTSRLSPHLHFGEVSIGEVWHAIPSETFRRQLGWREFGLYFLCHFPETPLHPWRAPFEAFPWEKDPVAFRRWCKGLTGYPIVDAGMRQLWRTGYLHNRVRMIVASFLVKDLRLHWLEGARWFWDTLVDADLANNTLGWQWVAGCGPDAAPYFRIFNPVLQGQKFDPEGKYVRHYVPELTRLPNKWIHHPWDAPDSLLREAGVHLGENYPYPMVDHRVARDKALKAFHSLP